MEGTYTGPPFKDKKQILHQVTKGLAYLHRENVVHGDIKPTNILIFVLELSKMNVKPKMKLADFGLHRLFEQDQRDFTNSSITELNSTIGWMAPEKYRFDRFDFKVDIFPLGCIFAYTLSGGKHPFGEDAHNRFIRIIKKTANGVKTE